MRRVTEVRDGRIFGNKKQDTIFNNLLFKGA